MAVVIVLAGLKECKDLVVRPYLDSVRNQMVFSFEEGFETRQIFQMQWGVVSLLVSTFLVHEPQLIEHYPM